MSEPDEICLFIHCVECLEEISDKGIAPCEYQRISYGWTEKGLQVWCDRHQMNILNLDFMGQKIKGK